MIIKSTISWKNYQAQDLKKLINFPAYGFPVSLKKMYFSSMGFDINEINHLLLSDESFVFQSIGSEGEPLHYTQSNYVPVMTKRLSILRENGTKMGLLTPSDYFKAMKNWRGLVTCIGEKAKHHNTSHTEETKGEKTKHICITQCCFCFHDRRHCTITIKN